MGQGGWLAEAKRPGLWVGVAGGVSVPRGGGVSGRAVGRGDRMGVEGLGQFVPAPGILVSGSEPEKASPSRRCQTPLSRLTNPPLSGQKALSLPLNSSLSLFRP